MTESPIAVTRADETLDTGDAEDVYVDVVLGLRGSQCEHERDEHGAARYTTAHQEHPGANPQLSQLSRKDAEVGLSGRPLDEVVGEGRNRYASAELKRYEGQPGRIRPGEE